MEESGIILMPDTFRASMFLLLNALGSSPAARCSETGLFQRKEHLILLSLWKLTCLCGEVFFCVFNYFISSSLGFHSQ